MSAKKKRPFFGSIKAYAGIGNGATGKIVKMRKKIFERNFLKKIDMPMPYEFLSATVHSNRIYLNL